MTRPGASNRVPGLGVRLLLVFAATGVVAVLSLGAVNLVTRRAPPGVPRHDDAETRHRAPDPAGGAGELAVQALLVAGIAVAGRTVLKIRL